MTAAAAVARPPARLRRRVRSSPARTARRSRRESSAMVARGAREKSYSWHAAGTCRGPGSSAVEIAASRAGPPGPWFPPSRPTGARSTAASEPVAPVSRNTGVTPCRAQLLHASGLGEPAAASGAEGSSSSVPLAHCFRHSHRRDSFGHKPVAPCRESVPIPWLEHCRLRGRLGHDSVAVLGPRDGKGRDEPRATTVPDGVRICAAVWLRTPEGWDTSPSPDQPKETR